MGRSSDDQPAPQAGQVTLLDPLMPPPPDQPVWHNRSFMTFWAGQAISQLGDAIGGLALPLLVLLLTGSALHMGAVVALQAAPLPLLALPAGALVDRLDRRRTMLWCDTGRAVLFLGLALAHVLQVLDVRGLYVAAALLGTLQVIFYLAGQSAVPSLIPRGRIVEANSWVQAAAAGTALLGLPIAGLLIASIGPGRALVIDALSFVVSAFSLAAVRRPFSHPLPLPDWLPIHRRSFGTALRRVTAATLAGLAVVWRTPALRGATALAIGLNVVLSLGTASGLFRLRHDLHFSPTIIGFMFAGASAGAIMLALAAGPLRRRLGFAGALLVAVAIQAPLALGIGWATNAWILAIAYALNSGASSLFAVTTVSLRETIIPEPLLGRVSAAVQMLGALAVPPGIFVGGLLTEHIGASLTYTIMAGALILLLLVALLAGLRRLDASAPAVTTTVSGG